MLLRAHAHLAVARERRLYTGSVGAGVDSIIVIYECKQADSTPLRASTRTSNAHLRGPAPGLGPWPCSSLLPHTRHYSGTSVLKRHWPSSARRGVAVRVAAALASHRAGVTLYQRWYALVFVLVYPRLSRALPAVQTAMPPLVGRRPGHPGRPARGR